MSQQLYGDYAVYSYADARNDSRMLMATGSVSKTLDFMRGSCNLNGTFNRNSSHMFSQSQAVDALSTAWSAGVKVSGTPLRFFNFGYELRYAASRLSMNGASQAWLSSMKNELKFTFTPHPKWQWTVSGEHYRNQLADNQYKNVLMLDTRFTYRLGKRVELGVDLSNILNRSSYNYTVYSQLSSFESQRSLRGRQLLFSITVKK